MDAKLDLIESAEGIRVSVLEQGKSPISFYEALAIRLAEGYLDVSMYDYQAVVFRTQKAA